MSIGPYVQKTIKSLHQIGTMNILHILKHPLVKPRVLIRFHTLLASTSCTHYRLQMSSPLSNHWAIFMVKIYIKFINHVDDTTMVLESASSLRAHVSTHALSRLHGTALLRPNVDETVRTTLRHLRAPPASIDDLPSCLQPTTDYIYYWSCSNCFVPHQTLNPNVG
jgi:hypothetical protein